MGKIKYVLIMAFMCVVAVAAQAQEIADARNLYRAWREESVLQFDDQRHFYLSATVMTVENGSAVVRMGVGGMMSGYVVRIQGLVRSATSGEYQEVGEEQILSGVFMGFADRIVHLPADGPINALMVTLQPTGSFDDENSLRIYLPMEAHPGVMVQAGALATQVRCQGDCQLWSGVLPAPCKQETLNVCCKRGRFDVQYHPTCTVSCYYSDPCPVITEPDPVEPVVPGTGAGKVE